MKDLLDKGAVIQRDMETYAIAPHLIGGLITPKQLRDIADVAEKYNASAVKVTGAQRIAIVGIKEEDIDWMSENCLKVSQGSMNIHPVKFELEDIKRIYRKAL